MRSEQHIPVRQVDLAENLIRQLFVGSGNVAGCTAAINIRVYGAWTMSASVCDAVAGSG